MGVYLSAPETSKNTMEGKITNLRYCSSQMQGWRKTMQDADIHELDIGDGNAVFAVFDGHGGTFASQIFSSQLGHEVSKYVAEIFVQTLKADKNYKNKNYLLALNQCFKKIDQLIQSNEGEKRLRQIKGIQGHQLKISNGTGCTANVVLITKDHYYVGNIGDSRSVLFTNNQCVQMSFDHKPQSQIERNRIQRAGGIIQMGRVNGGLNLSRSFGDFDYKRNQQLSYDQQMITCNPDVYEYKRSNNDEFIIIGCDGIWQKFVTDSQGMCKLVKQLLQKHEGNYKLTVEELLDTLLAQETRQGVGCDNMTAILIGFK